MQSILSLDFQSQQIHKCRWEENANNNFETTIVKELIVDFIDFNLFRIVLQTVFLAINEPNAQNLERKWKYRFDISRYATYGILVQLLMNFRPCKNLLLSESTPKVLQSDGKQRGDSELLWRWHAAAEWKTKLSFLPATNHSSVVWSI